MGTGEQADKMHAEKGRGRNWWGTATVYQSYLRRFFSRNFDFLSTPLTAPGSPRMASCLQKTRNALLSTRERACEEHHESI